MQGIIVYDSRSGTTRTAARRMAEIFANRGHPCEAMPVGGADPRAVGRADYLCLGSWTRGLMVVGQHPTAGLMRFIDRLDELGDKPAVVFCTYKIDAGSTLVAMADAVEAAGANVIGRFAFRGPQPDESFTALTDDLPALAGSTAPRLVQEPRSRLAPLSRALIRTTNLTHGLQDEPLGTLLGFYGLWSRFYDSSMRLTPGYLAGLQRMVALVVRGGDVTLDVGCGTGLATLLAARRAQQVVGVDLSAAMLHRLERKLRYRRVRNVELLSGPYPEAVASGRRFDSAVSSFALVHLAPEARQQALGRLHDQLEPGGRLGLFDAQGEIAGSFDTSGELVAALQAASFERIVVRQAHDVYRITTARRPVGANPH